MLCCQCNQPLTLVERQPYTAENVMQRVNMDVAIREAFRDEQKAAKILAWLNEPRYECKTCLLQLVEKLAKGPFVPMRTQ